MNDDQLLRYSRHILLDDVGIEGQQRLVDSHVLIVGAGGLGSPVALYLAASGVGHISIADHDVVDLTNLQRQIAHTTARVGHPKVASASQAMLALNPDIRVTALAHKLDAAQLDLLVPTVQVVVDCCDNFPHPPRRQRRVREAPSAVGIGRGHSHGRPARGVRPARQQIALLRLHIPTRPRA